MSTRKGSDFMKRIKLETVILVLSILLVVFTVGFFAGRNRKDVIVIETQRSASASSEEERTQEAPELAVIDLNSASAAEMEALPGIGPALAAEIAAFREEHGRFSSVEEILEVPGIGDKKFEAIRDWITVR